MTRARDNADFGHLAGRRNLIINGDFRINQRGGTRTPGIGVYGYDRWKGDTNGLHQIVEQLNFEDGEYTLSWGGGGDGYLDSGALESSPVTRTITADNHVAVVVPADATNVQLERGNKATPFERRLIGEELALCQRYFWKMYSSMPNLSMGTNLAGRASAVWFPVTMRTVPTISNYTLSSGTDPTTYARTDGVYCYGTATATNATQTVNSLSADAEL